MDIFTYLKEERRTFSQKGFSILDTIVFSKLVYLKFDDIIPEEGIKIKDIFKAEYYDKLLDLHVFKEEYTKLLTLVVLSPRFRDIEMKYFVKDSNLKEVKQFSAITFCVKDKIVIAYRGTDSTVLGWKENFNMTYTYPIPSQEEALKYINEIYNKEKKKMIVLGHSKGGNLAVYSVINADKEIQKNIVKVYSLDGPGFPDEIFETKMYKNIKDKIVKIVPQESVVGVFLEKDKYLVCKSNEKGLMQHEPFFWKVKDKDLVYLKNISQASITYSKVIRTWIESATIEERELFVDTLFSFAETDKTPNLYSKFKMLQETPKFIHRYNKLEPDRKELMSKVFKNLVHIIIGREYIK